MIWWYESYIQGSSTASVCTIRCSRIPSQTNPDGLSLTYTHSVQCSKYSLCSKMFIVPEYHRIPTSVWYVRCVRYLVSNGGGRGGKETWCDGWGVVPLVSLHPPLNGIFKPSTWWNMSDICLIPGLPPCCLLLSVRVEWFLRKKLVTRQVVPNCGRTPIPKFLF